MSPNSNQYRCKTVFRSRKLWSVVLMSPTILLIAFFSTLDAQDFLSGRTICGDPRVDLARYMAYPSFFLVLPTMFASRVYDWIHRRCAMVGNRAFTTAGFYAVTRCLGALWLSLCLLLPILLSCCRLIAPWLYRYYFDGAPNFCIFFSLGFLPTVLVQWGLIALAQRFLLSGKLSAGIDAGQGVSTTEQKWRFRELLLPYSLGAISFWLLSSLIAVSVSTLLGVTFENPVTTNILSIMRSTIPLVWILLATATITNLLQVWQKPLRAIALGLLVGIVQLYPPVRFLGEFYEVCDGGC